MNDLQSKFAEAARVMHSGNLRRAHSMFADIQREHPACHEAMYMHGVLSAQLGDVTQAERDLRAALAVDGGNPEYLFRLGGVLMVSGKAELAAETLLEAERESEESFELLMALGTACSAASRHAEAERAFRRARELNPASPEAGLGVFSTLMSARRLDDAIAQGRALASEFPSRADIHARLAQALERANRLEEAGDAARQAFAINPGEPTALGVHATLLQRAGNKDESIPVFERAIAATKSAQEQRDLSRSLGLVLDELGRHDEAFRRFLASKKPAGDAPASAALLAREVESFIQACQRDLPPGATSAWSDPSPDEREAPVFFVGFPRSGTTLLEQVLGAHPRLATTDEIESIGACTEWIGQRAGRLDLAPAAYGSLSSGEIQSLRAMYWKKIDERLPPESWRGKRLIDKHPMNTANLFTARRLFPDSKVIVSLRDPRDVILSCFMHLSRTPMAVTYFRDLESAARLYARIMGLWFHMRTALGLPWMEVKYEDLVDDAEGMARRLVEFLGEDWSDAVLKFTEKSRGRTMRSTSYQQVSQGIYTRAKGRWRAYEKHFGAALEILDPYVRALGYEDR